MEIEQALQELKEDLVKSLRSELEMLEIVECRDVYERVRRLECSLDDILRKYHQKLRVR